MFKFPQPDKTKNRDLVAAGSAWTSTGNARADGLAPERKRHFSRVILVDGISLKPMNNYSMFKRRLMKICTRPIGSFAN